MIVSIKNHPKKINHRIMNKRKRKKSNVKVFFKLLNKNHVLPTRYFVDLNSEQQKLIADVSESFFKSKIEEKYKHTGTEENIQKSNNIFIDKYFSGKNKWFFKKLRF